MIRFLPVETGVTKKAPKGDFLIFIDVFYL
jgi:hypothetical protein